MMGVLDPCVVGVSEEMPRSADMTFDAFSELRPGLRDTVIGALSQSEHATDLTESAQADAVEGYMSRRVRLRDVPVSAHITRRLAVRQEKVKGGKLVSSTRVVDHCTESGLNPATQPVDRIVHETLDVMVWILLAFLNSGVAISMWKRDLKAAFRGCPIMDDHLDMWWVAWMVDGRHFRLWVTDLASLFGLNGWATYGQSDGGSQLHRSCLALLARYVAGSLVLAKSYK